MSTDLTVKEAIAELEKRKEFLTAQCDGCWDPAIEMALQALKRQQWIPCSERMPEHDETVLVWYCGEIRIGYLTDISSGNDVWILHGSFPFIHDEKKVVAWMPLPEAPEVEE